MPPSVLLAPEKLVEFTQQIAQQVGIHIDDMTARGIDIGVLTGGSFAAATVLILSAFLANHSKGKNGEPLGVKSDIVPIEQPKIEFR